MSEVYGAKVEAQRRLTFLDLGQPTANTTTVPGDRFGCPPGVAGVRIIGLHLCADAVFADADGTLLLSVLTNDVSEGGSDTLVSSQDVETLVTAANRLYELTLATETTEKEFTLEAGDTLRASFVSNSAAIDTNANFTLCVEWHPVPDHSDLDRINHPSVYDA